MFRKDWLHNNDFKNWLIPIEGHKTSKENLAGCRFCNSQYKSELTVIKNHLKSRKHLTNEQLIINEPEPNHVDVSVDETDNSKIKRCETILAGFLAENNLSFTLSDKLIRTIKNAVPDSQIVSKISLDRTKSTAIVTNVIGKYEKENLTERVKNTYFCVQLT
ncbi:hypothetical protein ABEB36_012580 [Hypothenemus hampei]|uniref:BED-type domain-containing protein n=1 Tax=Hypothenemus hampei TaxID=57062 RepID=A0ABD1EG11_HYPHA